MATMENRANEPVYVISIAAKKVDMHPQTLRLYERMGLVKPARLGSNRLYSDADIERLRQIQRLTQEMGVNLAGVEVILNLLEKIDQLQSELEAFRQTRLPARRTDVLR
jgi:MerR family transcriptional regulator, heat shock protein HspR